MEKRHKKDTFQILCRKMSDAINNYFSSSDPSTVIHVTHAANTLIRDLRRHFKKNEQISDFELWTERVDREAQTRLFNPDPRDEKLNPLSKKKGGKQGFYIELANGAKHADEDPEALLDIFDQHACEYLYATVKNFVLLRDVLRDAGVISLCDSFRLTFDGHEQRRLLSEPLSLVSDYLSLRKGTKVDYLVNNFLAWHAFNEEGISSAFPNLKHDFYDASSVAPRISLLSRLSLRLRRNNALSGAFIYLSGSIFRLEHGVEENPKSEDAVWSDIPYLRQQIRDETKGLMAREFLRPKNFMSSYFLQSIGSEPAVLGFKTIEGSALGLDMADRAP